MIATTAAGAGDAGDLLQGDRLADMALNGGEHGIAPVAISERGLTWLPTSIVFPLMSPPGGGNREVWFMENIKDSFVSWCLFIAIIIIGLWN